MNMEDSEIAMATEAAACPDTEELVAEAASLKELYAGKPDTIREARHAVRSWVSERIAGEDDLYATMPFGELFITERAEAADAFMMLCNELVDNCAIATAPRSGKYHIVIANPFSFVEQE